MKPFLTIALAIVVIIFMSRIFGWSVTWYKVAPSDADPRKYWRFILSIFATCVVSFLIFHFRFPDVNIKVQDQAWLIAGTGVLPGLIVGTIWQIISHESLSSYMWRGVGIVGFGSFLILASVFLSDEIPHLKMGQLCAERLNSIRALSKGHISQIDVMFGGTKEINIKNPDKIETFKNFLANAIITSIDKNPDLQSSRIQIYQNKDVFTYYTFVTAANPEDIMLSFSEEGTDVAFCLPGLKRWLDENILSKEK